MMLHDAPVLNTDRLILRGPEESDFEAVAAFMASDRTEFVGGSVADRWQQWRGFLGSIGHWALRGYGFFTVLHRDSGARVARVGVINHEMWEEPELGWQLFDGFEGQGFATEAAIAARDWVFSKHGLGPLVSYIAPGNMGSVKVAERLGARLERTGSLLGEPCLIYRHPDPKGAGQ